MNLCKDLSTENQILLLLARAHLLESEEARLVELLSEQIDWNELLDKAFAHRLTPLLRLHLKKHRDKIPANIFKRLEEHNAENIRRSIFLSGELIKLVKIFEAENISVIPYKGPALSALVYKDLTMREFVDLDVLICLSDVVRARKILLDKGFTSRVEIPDEQLKFYMRSECDQIFVNDKSDYILELHWAVTPPYYSFNLTTESLLEESVKIDFGSSKITSPSVENLLLILCVNAAKEMWRRLEWLCAVAELIKQNPQMNWEVLLLQAKKFCAERMLLLGLFLSRELLEITLPYEINKQINNDEAIIPLAKKACESLFQKERKLSEIHMHLFRMSARERFGDRVRYSVLRLITPTHQDLTAVKFPRWLYFLYYPLRPLRLLLSLFKFRKA